MRYVIHCSKDGFASSDEVYPVAADVVNEAPAANNTRAPCTS